MQLGDTAVNKNSLLAYLFRGVVVNSKCVAYNEGLFNEKLTVKHYK